jgi:hypothetical protein
MGTYGRGAAVALVAVVALTVTTAAIGQDRRGTALERGEVLLKGVTLSESTPIADLNADLEGYDGKIVQIEGMVVALCNSMGCWAQLDDGEGNRLNVKVEDGVIDLREITAKEHYMVAEGVLQKTGEHGAQVFIMEHGAVIDDGE